MEETLIIDRRFRGPPDSGHGGYVAGLLARHVSGPATITLRRPPPLDRPLPLRRGPDESVRLFDGETLVAEAVAGALELAVPPAPELAAVSQASAHYPGFRRHVVPACFVCGPERAAGDGLRVFAGPLPGQALFGAPWIPDASLADDGRHVRPEFVWAVLDCPAYFALNPTRHGLMLLGRLTAETTGAPRVGEPHVIIAWPLGHEGRKHYAGTALFTRDGVLLGRGRATWIEIPALP